jgi:hypothetical protein
MLTGLTHITPVTATEITDMQLVYDFGTQTLTVNVTHHSLNKNDIIETIEILKNGIFYMNRTYENQSDAWWRYDTFSVSAVVDDNLTVTATCSKDYSITRWLIVTSTTASNTPPTDTTSTTEPTGGTEPPDPSLGLGVAIGAAVAVVIFLIVFFAYLNPERVPEAFKKLGSRIRTGFSWLGEKLSSLFQHIKARLPSK